MAVLTEDDKTQKVAITRIFYDRDGQEVDTSVRTIEEWYNEFKDPQLQDMWQSDLLEERSLDIILEDLRSGDVDKWWLEEWEFSASLA